jgi:hypothetical protein
MNPLRLPAFPVKFRSMATDPLDDTPPPEELDMAVDEALGHAHCRRGITDFSSHSMPRAWLWMRRR